MDYLELRKDLLLACKAMVKLGLDAGPFGNLSLKVPGTTLYLENPAGVFFESLEAEDFVLLDYESGEQLSKGLRIRHQGDFIHGSIYRQHPRVNSVVHTHSRYSVILACLSETPEPWTQSAAAFHNDISVYSGFTGPVRDGDEGEAIAKALGDKSIVIAKQHGFFVTASNIARAVWDMHLIELISREHVDLKSAGLGRAPILTDETLEKSRRCVREEFSLVFWDNMKQSLGQP